MGVGEEGYREQNVDIRLTNVSARITQWTMWILEFVIVVVDIIGEGVLQKG